MSGRPNAPIVWDSGNYSAGSNPWSGTPIRVDPGYRHWTPALKASGQWVNFVIGNALDVLGGVVTMGGAKPALNWRVSVVVDATKALQRGVFSVKDQVWVGVGNGGSDWAMYSPDTGQDWSALGTATSAALGDVGADPSGNLLFTENASATVCFGTRTAYAAWTFATTSSALSTTPAAGSTSVFYDTTNSKWLVAYRNGALGMRLDNSSNGTTFTDQHTNLPATWTGYTGTANSPLLFTRTGGTTVACFYDDVNTKLRIAVSTNGGAAWTDAADFTPGFTPSGTYGVTRPTYDDQNGVWYVVLWQQSTTRKTQIFYSTNDGTSWTALTAWTTNDFCAQGLVALGSLLVACNDDGRIAYSTLSGASVAFQWAGRAGIVATQITMFGGGGGLGIFYPGARVFLASMRFDSLGQAI